MCSATEVNMPPYSSLHYMFWFCLPIETMLYYVMLCYVMLLTIYMSKDVKSNIVSYQ